MSTTQADDDDDDGAASPISLRFLVWTFVIVFAFSLLGLIPFLYFDATTASQFGDSFGAINAILSGLAFAAVILTLVVQQKELTLQRQELRLARREQRHMVHAQQEQAGSQEKLVKAQFLAAYFNAINGTMRFHAERPNATDLSHSYFPQAAVMQEVDDLIYRLHSMAVTFAGKQDITTDEMRKRFLKIKVSVQKYWDIEHQNKLARFITGCHLGAQLSERLAQMLMDDYDCGDSEVYSEEATKLAKLFAQYAHNTSDSNFTERKRNLEENIDAIIDSLTFKED